MKKIVIKQSISGYGDIERSGNTTFSYAPDQTVEIEDELASAWVNSGVAVWATKVAPKAEYAVAKKPEAVVVPKVVAKEDATKEG